MCKEGGLGHLFGDALQWVSQKASHLLHNFDVDAIDFDSIDSDLHDLPDLLKLRNQQSADGTDAEDEIEEEDDGEYSDDLDDYEPVLVTGEWQLRPPIH